MSCDGLWRISTSKEFHSETYRHLNKGAGGQEQVEQRLVSSYRKNKQVMQCQPCCLCGWEEGHSSACRWALTDRWMHTHFSLILKQSACCEFPLTLPSRSASSLRGFSLCTEIPLLEICWLEPEACQMALQLHALLARIYSLKDLKVK